jgi:hypothetical protein
MLAEIEESIPNILRSKWDAMGGTVVVGVFDINKDFEDIIKTPAVSVAIEYIGLNVVVDGVVTFKPNIAVYQVFKDVGKPDQRRQGVYPIVMGCIRILTGSTLDLEIEGLEPVSSNEIYHETLKKLGLICFKTSFKSSFNEESMDDADVVRLLSEGLNYYKDNTDTLLVNDGVEF